MTVEQDQGIRGTIEQLELREDRPLDSLIANTSAYSPDGTMLEEFPQQLLAGDLRCFVPYWEDGSLRIIVVTAPTPPDGHYQGIVFYWDALFAAQVFAALARNRQDLGFAIGNLEAVLAGMDGREGREGAVYNMFFLDDEPGNWAIRLECKFFETPDDPEARTSKYLQPPLQAETGLNIYDAIVRSGVEDAEAQAKHFSGKFYERLSQSYEYLIEHRRLAKGLYYLIHTHATGRDSSPEYAAAGGLKGFRVWWGSLREKELVKALEESRLKDVVRKLGLAGFSVADIAGIVNHNRKCKARNWETEACREICQIEDIMYNSLLQKNLEAMGEIATWGRPGSIPILRS